MILASATAGEPPIKEPAEPGISEAKRDYEALKAARVPANQAAVPLPAVSVYELRTEETKLIAIPGRRLPNGKQTERELAAEQAKSRNWLLAAMAEREKESDRSRANRDGAAKADLSTTANTLGDFFQEKTTVAAESIEERRPVAEVKVNNPLDRFMASWMTTDDFQLLATTPGPGLGEAPSEVAAPFSIAARESGMSGRAESNSILETASPSLAENPYLRDSPAGVAPLDRTDFATPPVALPSPISPASVVTPLESAGNPPPTLSEQLRTRGDDRYFKQLKRF